MNIHQTAIINKNTIIGKNCEIGPYSIIGENVKIEDNVKIMSHVCIDGHTTIGKGTTIFPFAIIGYAPQDLKYQGEKGSVIIGKNNTIREYSTIHIGTKSGKMKTIIGDNCLFMVGTHIAHDCSIGNNVIMANNATLAGHVTIEDNVIIGGLSAVHQFVKIGQHAIIGGMSPVAGNVIPYGNVYGERANLMGINIIGMKRNNFNQEEILATKKGFDLIFGKENIDKTFEERINLLSNSSDYKNKTIQNIVKFLKEEDERGVFCMPPWFKEKI